MTDGQSVYNKQSVDAMLSFFPPVSIKTFNAGGLTITMKDSKRFCFEIIGTGINTSSWGAAYIWGYGLGGTLRYHAITQGNFSVNIGAEDTKQFTVTCGGANQVTCTIRELLHKADNAQYEIVINQ